VEPEEDALRAALALAERQHGVIIRAQLHRIGWSAVTIRKLGRDGWLREVRPGAYAVAGRPPSTWEQAMAVALLVGPHAALSHLTAASIHGVPGLAPSTVCEISVPSGRHPRLPGVKVHRTSLLDSCDLDDRRGVRVTTPARTLVDLAGRLEPRLLARVIDEGSVSRLWSMDELAACAARLRKQGRPGSRVLKTMLADRQEEPPAQSALELRMIRVLAPFGPFETQFQVVLENEVFLLDVAWPWWRVGAEVDGWWVRARSRRKLDQDSHKTNMLVAHGWKVAHLTSAMSDTAVLRDVGRLLPPGVGRR
jgi:hypothetical protein